jgi:ribonuclease MRP protein subunit RMP1
VLQAVFDMAVLNSLQPIPVNTFEPLDIMPQISAKKLLRATDKDKQALADIHELLDRLFVRNRNQHRRSLWFKSLQQFRKQLGLLITEHESKKSRAVRENLLLQRLQFLDDRHIHQWYL